MSYELLEVVVLSKDAPESGLRSGDLGTIVEVYDDTHFEVEFVLSNGMTQALLTLSANDIRKRQPTEISSVRPVDPDAKS